jgi:threonine synthase
MSIWQFAHQLPAIPEDHRITLGEGNTPLLKSKKIGPENGIELYFKLENCNPTGSYKDRFAAMAVSQMIADGKTRCVATSSGNTGAALAAYCAAANITCEIAIVETAPEGKLWQMQAYGAQLFRVRGFGLDSEISQRVTQYLQQQASRPDAALQISAFAHSPIGMSGVQSISYEIAAQLPEVQYVFSPSGGGGLTLAVARGFNKTLPKVLLQGPQIHCVQPAGNDTIASALRAGADAARDIECTSQISGLQVPYVLDGNDVIKSCRASGGTGHIVDDETVWQMQQRLAREEGVFCEPAGAVALAGALQARANGEIADGAKVVCLVTGSGFKDQTSLQRMAGAACPMLDVNELGKNR